VQRFEFDYFERFSFFAIHALYHKLIVLIIAISLSLLAFRLATDPLAIILLLSSITLAILFEAWMTYNYEGYLHSKYPLNLPVEIERMQKVVDSSSVGIGSKYNYTGPTNYTTIAYATTIILGLSTIVAFVMGMLRLALLCGGQQS
jgi:energy-coupling factor transporter transmembrane protein EcfT